jgi:AcrR family transcriptional regulator
VEETNEGPAGRGRPRDPKVDEAIHDATLELLWKKGWAGTTMEEVAERAGVAKTSVYRRFPSKIALVADTATRERDQQFPSFDTGTAWGDLTAFVLGTFRMLLGSVWHRVLPAILAEAVDDPAISAVVQRYWAWRREAVARIVERAVDRGEMLAGTDPEFVLDGIDGPILFRLMVTRAPLDAEYADLLVEHVMAGVGTAYR